MILAVTRYFIRGVLSTAPLIITKAIILTLARVSLVSQEGHFSLHFYSRQNSPSAWVYSQTSVRFAGKRADLPQLRLKSPCVLSHRQTSPHFISMLFDSPPREEKMEGRSQKFQITLQKNCHMIYRRNESLAPSFTSCTSAYLNDVETPL